MNADEHHEEMEVDISHLDVPQVPSASSSISLEDCLRFDANVQVEMLGMMVVSIYVGVDGFRRLLMRERSHSLLLILNILRRSPVNASPQLPPNRSGH
jgi:hypothetical protein